MPAVILALWALLSPLQHDAQPAAIFGRVVRVVRGDTLAAPGASVVLHRVSTTRKGPVDSMLARTDGSFRFRVRPDSGDILLVSARWGGVEYFGPPFPATALTQDQEGWVIVSDSSSSARVTMSKRQIVVMAPDKDGGREVVDVVSLGNTSGLTRVTTSGFRSTWQLRLPEYAVEIHLDESDFSTDAFQLLGDTLLLLAPIPPGEHSFYLSYHIPRATRRFLIPAEDSIAEISVMGEESALKVNGPFHPGESKLLEDKTFIRWDSDAAFVGEIELRLPGDGTAPDWLLPVLVGTLGLGLVVVSAVAVRRRSGVSPPNASPALSIEAVALMDRIAELDRQHGTDSRNESYLAERARLKEELRSVLKG